jgi:hypothetical protein
MKIYQPLLRCGLARGSFMGPYIYVSDSFQEFMVFCQSRTRQFNTKLKQLDER